MPSESSPDLAHLLSHAERRLVRRLAVVLAEEDCSVEQWRVLSSVADGRGHPMTEIADHALIPAPSLTKLVDLMVADNLVYRRPDPADRRRVLLQLTPRGRALHRRAAQRVHTEQAQLLDAITGHDQLITLLPRLTETLNERSAIAPAQQQRRSTKEGDIHHQHQPPAGATHREPRHAATGRNAAVTAHPPGEKIQFG